MQISCPSKHSYLESIPKIDIFGMARFVHNSILFKIKLSSIVYTGALKAGRSISNKPYRKQAPTVLVHTASCLTGGVDLKHCPSFLPPI